MISALYTQIISSISCSRLNRKFPTAHKKKQQEPGRTAFWGLKNNPSDVDRRLAFYRHALEYVHPFVQFRTGSSRKENGGGNGLLLRKRLSGLMLTILKDGGWPGHIVAVNASHRASTKKLAIYSTLFLPPLIMAVSIIPNM